MTGCGLVQCFKCCMYGHIAKNCRAKARCGHCSGTHETRDCSQKTQKSCATCKASGHKETSYKAWDELCPVRVAARLALRGMLETRPVVVVPDRRPLAEPTTIPKPGRPSKEAVRARELAKDKEGDGDPMEVDSGRENKRKRQSTLSFPARELDESAPFASG